MRATIDLAFAGGAGALDQDVVSGDDVLVAHGVAAYFEGEDLAVAMMSDRRCSPGFDGLDGLAGCDAAISGRRSDLCAAATGRTSMERLRLCAR